MDVERREEWLKQYDYEVVINPKESPLQVKIELPCTVYVNKMVTIFNCVIALISKFNIILYKYALYHSIINTNKKGGSTLSLMVITSCVSVSNLTLNAFRFVGFFL